MDDVDGRMETSLCDPRVMAALGSYLGEEEACLLERTNRSVREAVRQQSMLWIDLYRRRGYPKPSVIEGKNTRETFLHRLECTKKWKFGDPIVHVGGNRTRANVGRNKHQPARVELCAEDQAIVNQRDACLVTKAVEGNLELHVLEEKRHADAVVCFETWCRSDGQVGIAVGCREGQVKTVLAKQRGKSMRGHTKKVNCMEAKPERKSTLLATGSADSTIVLWKIEEGNDHAKISKKTIMRGHGEAIVHLAWTESYLLSAGADGKVKLWDVEKGHCLQTSKFPAPIKFMKSVGRGTVVLATAKSFLVLPPGELQPTHTFPGENFLSMDATCVHGVPIFAIGRENGSVKVWDCRREKPGTLGFSDGDTPVSHLKMDAGKLVAASKACSTIKVWELPDLHVIHEDVFACISRPICHDPEGRQLAPESAPVMIEDIDAKGSTLAALTSTQGETSLVLASFAKSSRSLHEKSGRVYNATRSKFWQYEPSDEDACHSVGD
uniref:Uncharacterized protein n=1 Tax=Picocystis salinarum TaxID=88271 RepID=A0A6U9RNA4_9CHLO|mmetsp:Transcript_6072/g.21422  ORF Transcript_6072/g.21422 Transcript_6072/m.21422 type:complete len:495 (+) Transcript_6072:3-1487(+)